MTPASAASTLPTLAALVEHLAVDAINVQLRFDADHEAMLPIGLAVAALLAPAIGGAASGLVPPRLRVDTFELRTRVRVGVGRSRGAAVTAAALNLAYDVGHGTTATTQSALHLRVAQVPLANGPAPRPA